MVQNVTALILAAGSSKRMGQAKQLLEYDGSYLLEYVIQKTLPFPFTKVLAVIGHKADRIKQSICIDDERFRWVMNPDFAQGQSFSLQAGMKQRGMRSDMMVFLGDQPQISDETVWTVLKTGLGKYGQSENQPYIVQPTFQGTPGHPVFFGNLDQMDFSNMRGDQGARNVIKNIKKRVLLPLEDPGILIDIDTRDGYEKAKQSLAERLD